MHPSTCSSHIILPHQYSLQHSCNSSPHERIHMHCVDHTLRHQLPNKLSSYKFFVVTLLGIWNLDFFLFTFPPFCIDKNYSTLRVLSFDYINAFYPLALLIVTYRYICIELYDKNYCSEQFGFLDYVRSIVCKN